MHNLSQRWNQLAQVAHAILLISVFRVVPNLIFVFFHTGLQWNSFALYIFGKPLEICRKNTHVAFCLLGPTKIDAPVNSQQFFQKVVCPTWWWVWPLVGYECSLWHHRGLIFFELWGCSAHPAKVSKKMIKNGHFAFHLHDKDPIYCLTFMKWFFANVK